MRKKEVWAQNLWKPRKVGEGTVNYGNSHDKRGKKKYRMILVMEAKEELF